MNVYLIKSSACINAWVLAKFQTIIAYLNFIVRVLDDLKRAVHQRLIEVQNQSLFTLIRKQINREDWALNNTVACGNCEGVF